MLEKTEMSLA